MPTRLPALCRCGARHPGGSRCPADRPAWVRGDGTAYGTGVNTRRWRKLRKQVLDETPLCRCGRVAAEVDHIWPIEFGGARWDRDNLQALCSPCHKRKTIRDRDGARRAVTSVKPYTVVCGPPLAGKTFYVGQRALRGDLVVDLDDLTPAMAFGTRGHKLRPADRDALHPFAVEARNAILDRLARPHDLRHAWVITGAPRRSDRARFRGADVIVLPTPADVCLSRMRELRRPARTAGWIAAWWDAYEPD